MSKQKAPQFSETISDFCQMLAEALNMAIEAVEKQIPKIPIWIKYNISADLDPFPDIRYQCPVCYKSFKEEYDECPNCGQKLNRSEQYEI